MEGVIHGARHLAERARDEGAVPSLRAWRRGGVAAWRRVDKVSPHEKERMNTWETQWRAA